MKKEPNKTLVGFFMVISVILFTVLVASKFVREYMTNHHHLVVLYFSESIAGLNVGSNVVYEGVLVGKVVKVEIKTNPKTLEFSIPVYIRFLQDNDFSHMSFSTDVTRREFLELLIKKGLRARLATQNLLTGQLMIELFMDANEPAIYHIEEGMDRANLEIPTTLSAIGNLARDIQDLPLKQIIRRFDALLTHLEESMPGLLQTYTQAGDKLNTYLDKSLPQTNQSLNQINQTLKDVSQASKSVKNLADYLERHPDSVIKGKKGD
ncbi:MAG: MCE family protein [Alphaproteobacteria bacterium]|nr:MCE family protein [Alphaproteobacteria bacterium]